MANGRFKLMEGLDMSATVGTEEWRSKYKETILRTKAGLKLRMFSKLQILWIP